MIASMLTLCLAIAYEVKTKNEGSYFGNILISGTASDMQEIELYQEAPQKYCVFFSNDTELDDLVVHFSDFRKLKIDNVYYKSGECLQKLIPNNIYEISAIGWFGRVENATVEFVCAADIPGLYMKLDEKDLRNIHASKANKETALYYAPEKGTAEAQMGVCSIKTRGNSSFSAKQKSYSISFDSVKSLFGLSAVEEWAILANYGKSSVLQLKNKIALDIAKLIGMEYSPECRYVNLYINNQYQGVYLLAQKISADGGVVHLSDEKNINSTQKSYLLEFDARYAKEPVWFKTENNPIVIKYPEVISEEELNSIAEYVGNIEQHFENDDLNEDFIDLSSWSKMYLMQEFFVNWDVEFASFYMYKKQNASQLYAGPVWEFELGCGEMFQGYYPKLAEQTIWLADRDSWLGKLEDYDVFRKNIKAEYLGEFSTQMEVWLKC